MTSFIRMSKSLFSNLIGETYIHRWRGANCHNEIKYLFNYIYSFFKFIGKGAKILKI